jgi:hypothetical protein
MAISIKGYEEKASERFFYSWEPGKMLNENTREALLMLPNADQIPTDEWESAVVSRFSTHFGSNKVIVASPEMFSHISNTPQFNPVGKRHKPASSMDHVFEGQLSPSNVEVWVNFFWPKNVVSSFDRIEKCENRVDFVFEWL